MARTGSKKPTTPDQGAERKNQPAPGKKKVTLHLPITQARALKVYAAQTDKDMSALVSELLEKAGIR